MAVKTPVDYAEDMWFLHSPCQDWLPLFEITKNYDSVYKWFGFLKTKDHHVRGYSPDSHRDAKSFTCLY